MGLGKKTIDDQNYCGKKVLVRCDFNVPMKDGVITNENRINAALPTIQKLVNDGAKVILCSHLGKPKNGPEAKFSLAPRFNVDKTAVGFCFHMNHILKAIEKEGE